MIICQCKGTTDRQIHEARRSGARDSEQVARHCEAGTACGGCLPTIEALLRPAASRTAAAPRPLSAA